jgi:hypothetical protein
MNHRKRKQAENAKKPKKEKYDPYKNDPPDEVCPYCGRKGKACSYVNNLDRAWARAVCQRKNK